MQYPNPRAAAYGLAILVALAIACDLLWMPIQVGDSLGEIVDAQRSPSVWASFTESLGTEAYLRPFRIAQIKALFDLAQGAHYWLVYRGFHALLLIAAVLLFTRALRVSTTQDFAAAAFALVVFVGLNTFRGAVQEAFPINHFLEILLLCLLTLNLARSRGGLWVNAAGAVTFVVAALTLESGLLVWVVAASAWAVGWRGISARGLAVMTALLLGYLYVRFAYLSTGVPTMTERSSGYLLELLDPAEITRRFGEHPLWFHTYNVMVSISSVLFSEPRSGVFEAVRGWLDGRPLPRYIVPIATSMVTTGLIVWASTRRVARWRELDDTARFILVFVAVLAANAVLSFAYTKDEIVSTAGAFYALAAFGAMREALLAAGGMRRAARRAFALLLCILSVGWTIRGAGVHYVLRSQAVKHQTDWVALPERPQGGGERPSDTAEGRLIMRLRADAVGLVLPNTRIDHPEWPARIWTE
jgi:hypothetical protein